MTDVDSIEFFRKFNFEKAKARKRHISDLQEKWTVLLDQEEAQFEFACQLDRKNGEKTPAKSDAVRAWFGTANAILWMMIRAKEQDDIDLVPFPKFTLGRLANITEELSVGNMPGFVSDSARAGRQLWRVER